MTKEQTSLYRIEFGDEGHQYVLQRHEDHWRVSRRGVLVERYQTAWEALDAIRNMFEKWEPSNDDDAILLQAIQEIL